MNPKQDGRSRVLENHNRLFRPTLPPPRSGIRFKRAPSCVASMTPARSPFSSHAPRPLLVCFVNTRLFRPHTVENLRERSEVLRGNSQSVSQPLSGHFTSRKTRSAQARDEQGSQKASGPWTHHHLLVQKQNVIYGICKLYHPSSRQAHGPLCHLRAQSVTANLARTDAANLA